VFEHWQQVHSEEFFFPALATKFVLQNSVFKHWQVNSGTTSCWLLHKEEEEEEEEEEGPSG
jgi:hypothetical protein